MAAGMVFGHFYAAIAYRDSDGYPMGQLATPDSPVNGTVYTPYLVPGSISIGFPSTTLQTVRRIARQKELGRATLGVSDLGEVPWQLTDYDETVHTMATNSAADSSTASSVTMTGFNAGQTVYDRFLVSAFGKMLMDDGTIDWISIHFLNVEVQRGLPGQNQNDGDNPNPIDFTLIPSLSTRSAHGQLLSGTSMSLQDDKDVAIVYRSDYPMMISTYVDDGVAVSYTLGYLPASSDATGAQNIFTDEGALDAANVSAVNTSTGAVSVTAADAGDRRVALYAINTNFTASA